MNDPLWQLDPDGFVVSAQTGTRCARMAPDGDLLLYDKRMKTSLPFSVDDWQRLRKEAEEMPYLGQDGE